MIQPTVVIIGGGVVGASLADEITAKGWTNVTVVDAGRLPDAGGSSSHAPGVVFQTNGSQVMTELAKYTVDKLSSLSWRDEPCFLSVGGLEIATTPERAEELKRRFGYSQSWGVAGARLLDPAETVATWDLLDPEHIYGGLYVPSDGIAKSVRAIAAQLDRAVSRGARILDGHEVIGITTTGGKVTGVDTDLGHLDADIVVCCAGIWGPKIAAMVGQALALTPLAHQLAWTAPIPALAGHRAEATRPVLRHQDADLYYRENGNGIGIGSYRHRPMPTRVEDFGRWGAEIMPSVQPFTPEDFEFAVAESARILPATAGARLSEAINGVFSFTVDNMPLLGPHASVDGFWFAEAVWVTHSAGVGRAMAEWIVDGYSSTFDLHACDVNRFEKYQLGPQFVEATNLQNFVEVYDIMHPLQPREHSRPLRTSPFYPRQQELGGMFLEAGGWERPHWYSANDALVTSDRNTGWNIPQPDEWASQYWSPTIAAEAAITRTDVALYDMTALKRLEVSGHGATDFLQGIVTGNVGRSVGSVTYCLMLGENGTIRSDVTVARLGEELYQVGANGVIDLNWLRRQLPEGSAVQVRDTTAGTCCIGIWGPRARAVVQSLTDEDFSHEGFGYFKAKTAYLGLIEVTAMRLSYVGELGWELYCTADVGLALWDTLMAAGQEHGIIAAGRGAFNSLRLEKGYRSFGSDMNNDHTPAEAGVEFAVRMAKPHFLGREALSTSTPPSKKLSLLIIDEPNGIVLGSEPVYAHGEAVGYVTSAAYAYTLGTPLAYAWLPIELCEPGTSVQIGYFNRLIPATVRAEPAFDPKGERIRC
ncbi:GcvT family protein [Cryobacterium psychrophilum]|uniref:FAD-dependent oxidoreductase n=1 Tax=Cryobacterium psychrophilum TaxID=41988 RepID=A0A4Y8KQK8_9MICO|nr:dimethylglycine oxidase [Cryobacterium psychrophilum]TFD81421.1 FAD-dependent oxidoreductase [Cryobacterium psychrophilum]